jgi:hypothetical protein
MTTILDRMCGGFRKSRLGRVARLLSGASLIGSADDAAAPEFSSANDRLAEFLVVWKVHVEASTPEGAAREALEALIRPGSVPPLFEVSDEEGWLTMVEIPEWTCDLRVVRGSARRPRPPRSA